MEKKFTFCRLCEASCGFIAEVEENRIVKYYPDKDHPVSRGYSCIKGREILNIQYHSKRIRHPLKRKNNIFEKISWEQAIDEIGDIIIQQKNKFGPESIGAYFGNPLAFSYSMTFYSGAFIRFLGTKNLFTAGSQDCNNKFAHSALFYGSPSAVISPDFDNIDYFLGLGTNPLASHFSCCVFPRPYERLKAMLERGCKITWVNPRKIESARRIGEHCFIRPDMDIFFLFALIHYILDRGLEDKEFIDKHSTGIENLRDVASEFGSDLVKVGRLTGIEPQKIVQIANEFSRASKNGSASIYGRVGISRSTFATMVSWAVDVLNFITGNIDKKGNFYSSYGRPQGKSKKSRKSTTFSRIGGFPRLSGTFPAAIMADEILTRGEGQIKSMIVMAGDPLVSCPNTKKLAKAFSSLDLLVSIDWFINDTGSIADYILPATTFLEREDIAMFLAVYNSIPFIHFSNPVVQPEAEEKQEWEIFTLLSKKIELPTLGNQPREIAKSFLSQTDLERFDELVNSEKGIFLNNEKKLSYNTMIPERIEFPDRLIRLVPDEYEQEFEKLRNWIPDPTSNYPYLLISGRHIETLNSWIHIGRETNYCYLNSEDAVRLGINNDDCLKVSTSVGSIEIQARITEDLMAGVVWIPHGWGRTVADPPDSAMDKMGANINLITDDNWEKLETFAGMVLMDGVPVRVERC